MKLFDVQVMVARGLMFQQVRKSDSIPVYAYFYLVLCDICA